MGLSLTELHTLRDRLQRARLAGIREVQDTNGERVVYKSESEMAHALDALDREISAMGRKQPHTIIFRKDNL